MTMDILLFLQCQRNRSCNRLPLFDIQDVYAMLQQLLSDYEVETVAAGQNKQIH